MYPSARQSITTPSAIGWKPQGHLEEKFAVAPLRLALSRPSQRRSAPRRSTPRRWRHRRLHRRRRAQPKSCLTDRYLGGSCQHAFAASRSEGALADRIHASRPQVMTQKVAPDDSLQLLRTPASAGPQLAPRAIRIWSAICGVLAATISEVAWFPRPPTLARTPPPFPPSALLAHHSDGSSASRSRVHPAADIATTEVPGTGRHIPATASPRQSASPSMFSTLRN